MELEFDKEIDAILRKNARGPTAVKGLNSAHLEADEIAAFAENALPANARSFYTKHLADCDRCRTVLSHTISLVHEAEPVAASSVADDAVISIKKPTWFQKLFAMPGLATAMGGLVVVFVALLGYAIYQGSFSSRQADVASVRKSESAEDNRPFSVEGQPSANAASNSSNTAASSSTPTITSEGSPLNKTLGQSDVGTDQPVIGGLDQKQPADGEKNETQREEEDRSRAASPAAEPPPAPPPVMKEVPTQTDTDAKKLVERKVEDKRDVAKTESADTVAMAKPEASKDGALQNSVTVQNQNSQNVGGAASKSKSGPYRNMEQQRNTSPVAGARADDEAPANRRAGGKSFEKKNGAWYDSAYRGQPTINIRRRTGEYKILDSGLRSIAESIGGTVVVVWKDKAYRIQ